MARGKLPKTATSKNMSWFWNQTKEALEWLHSRIWVLLSQRRLKSTRARLIQRRQLDILKAGKVHLNLNLYNFEWKHSVTEEFLYMCASVGTVADLPESTISARLW